MTKGSSYRTILRSSSIVGGALVDDIVAGLVKMRAAAVLLGPGGVGLVGLYMNLIQTAGVVASMGFGTVGTRQIAAAEAEGGEAAVGRSLRALFWGTPGLSVIGAALFWLASGWIARVYDLYNVPVDAERGGHAHSELEQIVFALSGSFRMKIDDGWQKSEFWLRDPRKGLYISRLVWREMDSFSQGAACMVLALPCRAWPIAHPSMPETRLRHQSPGSNT